MKLLVPVDGSNASIKAVIIVFLSKKIHLIEGEF
jgi:hypothetical protein